MLAPLVLAVAQALAAGPAAAAACPSNATLVAGWSVGARILRSVSEPGAAACCAACEEEPRCLAFVLDDKECYLKADVDSFHAKAGQTAGFVRAPAPPHRPTPPGPPAPGPPGPPAPGPPGSPQWETVVATPTPVIGRAESAAHGIFAGFETGQFQRIGDTSRRRDCHFAGTPPSSILKRLLNGEGGAA